MKYEGRIGNTAKCSSATRERPLAGFYLQPFLVEYIRGQLPHRICIVIQMQLSVSEYIKSNTLPQPIHDDDVGRRAPMTWPFHKQHHVK